ncbi:MAG: TIGR00730 family Rossman fold protein [Rhodobiaceae bacterium]|nr:TIGR00730 family Rossman fold protein [Rhodobiaceae bacterium]|tara:strand:- start:465 stop:1061 length:597 start_codon:yes stop_codon:yes gene_type:complete
MSADNSASSAPSRASKPTRLDVCVYCGSSTGDDPKFSTAAAALGTRFAAENVGLVYGGGKIGLMGICARTVMEAGGRVTGIIPDFLQTAEIAYEGISELHVTRSMHERKQLMFDKSDAFVALPGGIGTLEEVIEMLTWAQLGRHNYPIIFLNIAGFWDPLISLFDHMISNGFMKSGIRGHYAVVDRVEDVLPRIEAVL